MTIRTPTEISMTDGEIPIWFGQMSWAANWIWVVFGGFFLLFTILSLIAAIFSPEIFGIVIFFGFFTLFCLGIAWLNIITSEYFISNKRIFVKYGWISRVMNDIKMEWVTNTSLSQDIFGRMFNFGNVLIATPGTATGTEMMMGIKDPMIIKGMIVERLSKFKNIEEINQSIRRMTDEFKMGRLDEARYNELKQEYESEIRKIS